MIYLFFYIILGVIVASLTFVFTDEEINPENIVIGIMFWPIGVIWFLLWLADK